MSDDGVRADDGRMMAFVNRNMQEQGECEPVTSDEIRAALKALEEEGAITLDDAGGVKLTPRGVAVVRRVTIEYLDDKYNKS